MRHRLRDASPHDADALARIYAPYVRDTAVSFELEAPDAAAMAARLRTLRDGGYPYLVATDRDDRVIGYAYAGPHRARAAYARTTETTVYLAPDATGQGLGSALMRALLERLEAQGFGLALAGVTLPNPASLALHRALGFDDVGVYHGVGFKFDAWHDVWWGQRRLRP